MDNLKDLYNAAVEVERVLGITDTPRLSTPILKERIGNNENIAGKLHVWREGEWREALGYISKDELIRLAPEPTPEEWQVGDVLETTTEYGGWQGKARLVAINESSGLDVRILELTDNPNKATVIGELIRDCNPEAFRLHHPTPEDRAKFELLAANAKLKAEWEKEKFAVQYRNTEILNDCWHDFMPSDIPAWVDQCEYRRKPDPVYVPWTADDDLLGVKVRSKSQPWRKSQVIEQNPSFVWIGDAQYRTYADFFAYFEQLDGTPCGKVKEEGK